ncbi:hypothetical protein PTSG_04304 [Salpingoeca rosetta]|uniref:RRM domain-containing protein n=1 Tax=Salpingoeca rosetta (strain ATCC 50818 / BSB-021) TaxID=946362 RepID=F2U767_SALR5|nr:uncharacterized protein PTSG_04304 [Salpingoeca rosetta]EGD83699.1 hypothetical protein PTSG_04304 [Salpingoeca rosetta]|eukprot:XP_004995203.1 hypothetical protein PTSG_04304 [Salpingoeca rosetta]
MADLDAVEAMLDGDLKQKKTAETPAQKTEDERGERAEEHNNSDRRRSRSPERRHSRSIERRRSRSPERRRTRSPGRRHRRSRSPRRRRTPSRSRSRSPSPHHRRYRRRSRTPPRYRRRRTPPYYRRRHRRSRSPGRRHRSPGASNVDRDARTVTCLQLHRTCTAEDLGQFLEEKAGKLVSCRIVRDRNTGRSKGIAYAEFEDESSVTVALSLTGQRLKGAPLVVMPTMAERNRQAAEKAKQEQLARTRVIVENLPEKIEDEEALEKLFARFGRVKKGVLTKDQFGRPLGYGYVVFGFAKDAKEAVTGMNGQAIDDKVLKVTLAVDASPQLASQVNLDTQPKPNLPLPQPNRPNFRPNMSMPLGQAPAVPAVVPPISRPPLPMMAPLMPAPPMRPPGVPGQVPAITPMPMSQPTQPQPSLPGGVSQMPTNFLKLSNMFDPAAETDPDWHEDVRDEVLEASTKYGPVFHIFVDKTAPQGQVFLKFKDSVASAQAYQAMNGRLFDGRTVKAEYMKETFYTTRFLDAADANTPLTVTPADDDAAE